MPCSYQITIFTIFEFINDIISKTLLRSRKAHFIQVYLFFEVYFHYYFYPTFHSFGVTDFTLLFSQST